MYVQHDKSIRNTQTQEVLSTPFGELSHYDCAAWQVDYQQCGVPGPLAPAFFISLFSWLLAYLLVRLPVRILAFPVYVLLWMFVALN